MELLKFSMIGVWVVAIVLYLIGFIAPYWSYSRQSLPDGQETVSYSGLWWGCEEAPGGGKEWTYKPGNSPGWFHATLIFMVVALKPIFLSVLTRICDCPEDRDVWRNCAVMDIFAGLFILIAIIIYGASVKAEDLHFAYSLSVCAGVIFLINGIAVLVLISKDLARVEPE